MSLMIGCVLGLMCLVWFYIRQKHQMWQKAGVEVPPYLPIIGHFYDSMLKPYRWEYLDKLYYQYKDQPYWGLYEYVTPYLYIRDTDLIRDVMVKDADHFIDRREFPFNMGNAHDLLFREMLVHEKGETWKNLRTILTPTFTSGKIKAMFNAISQKADELQTFLHNKSKNNGIVEVRKPLGEFTLSVIAENSFGLEIPIGDEGTEFGRNAERLVTFGATEMLNYLALAALPNKLCQMLNIRLAPRVTEYFEGLVKETLEARKTQKIRRNDFLDLLTDCMEESKKSNTINYRMTSKSIVSQSIMFLFAGSDTSANSLAHTFFLLAKNPHKQQILRNELNRILDSHGAFTYQNLMDAQYLDSCFSEALRMYGSVPYTDRKCTKDYKFEKTGLIIKKGTIVGVPSWSLHYDETYWHEPRTFKPERFLPENKSNINQFTYLPFGNGPRNCIGMRFALIEVKTVIAKIIVKHRLSLPEGHDHLTFNNEPFSVRASKHGVHIHFDEICCQK